MPSAALQEERRSGCPLFMKHTVGGLNKCGPTSRPPRTYKSELIHRVLRSVVQRLLRVPAVGKEGRGGLRGRVLAGSMERACNASRPSERPRGESLPQLGHFTPKPTRVGGFGGWTVVLTSGWAPGQLPIRILLAVKAGICDGVSAFMKTVSPRMFMAMKAPRTIGR